MKNNIRKHTRASLTRTSIILLVIYTVILAAGYYIASHFTNFIWQRSNPDIQSILNYESMINHDAFGSIPKQVYNDCSFIVFDKEGAVVYASNDDIRGQISYEDTQYIQDVADPYYFTILQSDDDNYWIFRYYYNEEDTSVKIDDYCVLDSYYNVIEGSLFKEKGQLSAREMRLIQGLFSSQQRVAKLVYMNANDEERTIIFLAPIRTERQQSAVRHKIIVIWAIIIGITVLLLILFSMLYVFFFRRALQPLNRAISDYGEDGVYKKENIIVPQELTSVSENFAQLTERLNEAMREQDEAAKEKNRIIMDLSHDLKTPLAVIQGYAQALESRKVPEEDVEKYLETIRRKSGLSVDMINDLVRYASMEHPDYEPERVRRNLTETCRACLADLYADIENAGMEMDVDIPDYPIYYDLDVKLINSLLQNLVGNSVKYNDPGTTVFFSLHETDTEIIMTVADNGVGIPEDIRGSVFKPFVTGNHARTSAKGTGIGMSIVKRVVELHDGTIQLPDTEGTAFAMIVEMRFPKKPEAEISG